MRDALEPLGWECVYANDFDASKQAIYGARFPDHEHFDGRNLWEVDAAELPRPVDLIAASFPCIDLSLAGNRRTVLRQYQVRLARQILAVQAEPVPHAVKR